MTPLLAAGTTLAEKYRIERLIAEGGMGVVYEGYHLVLEQRVAVKVVRPEYAHHPEAVARFLNEARAIARLRGHHIAHVLDTGRTDSGAPYMVLEFLEGRDLRTQLDTDGALPIGVALDYVLQACEAVAEAHAIGLIHRDLKPDNLFITQAPDGRDVVKVIDFGISKRLDDRGRSLTKQGQSLGSPHYMAPEQMSTPEQVDARADIWSLGVVLYELLSNTVPFTGDNLAAACLQVLTGGARPLRELRPEVSPELEQVVMRCLAKHREDRFSSIEELSSALLPLYEALVPNSQRRPISQRPVSEAPASRLEPSAAAALGEARTLMSGSQVEEPEPRVKIKAKTRSALALRRRAMVASAAAVVVAVVGALQAAVPRASVNSSSSGEQPVQSGLVARSETAVAAEPAPLTATVASPATAHVEPAAPEQRAVQPASVPQRRAAALPRAPQPKPLPNSLHMLPAPKPVAEPAPALRPTAPLADASELVNPYPDENPNAKSRTERAKR
ncbi:MAG: protein kinase domain-containing protein [Myxococcota bacterium]